MLFHIQGIGVFVPAFYGTYLFQTALSHIGDGWDDDGVERYVEDVDTHTKHLNTISFETLLLDHKTYDYESLA